VLVASKLAVASGVAVVVLCGALWFALSGAGDGEPAHAQARAELAAEPGDVEFANGPKPASEAAQERSEAPTSAAKVEQPVRTPWEAPTFEYELDVGIVDSLDLPRDRQNVFAAPAGHTLNEVGQTGEDGHLLLRWRGFQPTMELDLTLDPSGSCRRLRVSAGAQAVGLRVALPRTQLSANTVAFEVVVSGRRVQSVGDFRTTLEGPQLAQCLRDSEGRILWVEPALCDAPVAPAAVVSFSETEVLDLAVALGRLGYADIVRSPADSEAGRVAGVVLDLDGKPVKDAVVVAYRESLQNSVYVQSDAEGRFEMARLPAGEWNLRAGGGDHGRAQHRITVTAGGSVVWDARLERGLELKGRLVGPTGAALGEWVLEVESDDPLLPLVDATVTDSEGRFAIPNLPPRSLRVLAWPSKRSRGFASLVTSGVFAGEDELQLVAPVPETEGSGSITASVSDLEGRDPRVVSVTAWRDDTQRGTPGDSISTASQFEATDGTRSEVVAGPTEIALDGLGSGWHTLEIAFRGRAPLFVPRISCEPDQPVELGELLAPVPAMLELAGPPGSVANCSVIHRGATVELRCEFPTAANATLRLREGDYVFTRKQGDDSVSRHLQLTSGSTTSF
jgi:hypothetical protein